MITIVTIVIILSNCNCLRIFDKYGLINSFTENKNIRKFYLRTLCQPFNPTEFEILEVINGK